MWMPSLDARSGPKYLRIVEAMADDINTGRLPVGARLPTHRDLAWRLGVTVGTVSRAYAEGERRGLLVGEIGRGSFVQAGARSARGLAMPGEGGPQGIELGMNIPPSSILPGEFAAALADIAATTSLSDLLTYQQHVGRWSHRVAGAKWLARRGIEVPEDQIVVISGAQHGVCAALMALAEPGETVLTESLTWPGTRAVASLVQLTLKPVEMDEQGLLPDAFDAACRATGARLYYAQPTLQNPTTATLPPDRRQAIADIAERYDVTIIEDDIYGMLPVDAPPALAAYAPHRTVYIASGSKCVAPGLRIGFAALPEDRVMRFSAAGRAINWMAPPLMGELLARWIDDGSVEAMTGRIRTEVEARHAIATRWLDGFSYAMGPSSFHAWLSLPEPWRAQDLVIAGRRRGLALSPTELFVPGRGETPHAIRVSLTAPPTQEDLSRGLSVLVDLLRDGPELCLAEA